MIKQFVVLFIVSVMSVFLLTQCSCSKQVFKKTPPFEISSSHYQDWVGGIPGASGTSVHINLLAIDEGVRPDSLFFRQSKAKIDVKTAEKGQLWIANFRTNSPRDINMHSDPQEEYGNTVPNMEKIPFKLTDNEAVISFEFKGKKAYYKLTNLEKKEILFFPATKPKQ